MVYFTELKKVKVFDSKGALFGYLVDLVFLDGKNIAEITHLICFDEEREKKKISWSYVNNLELDSGNKSVSKIFLNDSCSKISAFFVKPEDKLVGSLIDKQVIDIDGVKVVRVNDILLNKVSTRFCVVGVAIGKGSFFRRLGFNSFATNIKDHVIPWKLIEMLDKQFHDIHLVTQKKKISDMHPEDIADLMEDLPHKHRIIIFEGLTKKKAARTLIDAEEEVQNSLINHMKIEKIKDILEEIPTHQAADILELMSDKKVEVLLSLMKRDTAAKIKKILNYNSESAGSIMKTDFIAVPVWFTAQKTIDLVRKVAPVPSRLFRLYAVDKEGVLKGSLSTRALLVAHCSMKIDTILNYDVISVKTTTTKDDLAKIMARYDLLVVPVVDNNDKLVGIVTADDIIENVIPERWNREKIKPHRLRDDDGLDKA